MLAQSVWKRLEAEWGPHTIDLMALDSNSQKDQNGRLLRHFTPWPTVNSAGINVFAQRINPEENIYAFPPMVLVGPLIRFLSEQDTRRVTIVVLDVQPRRFWWAILANRSHWAARLGCKGSSGPLLFPTRNEGFVAKPLLWDLWAFRLWN